MNKRKFEQRVDPRINSRNFIEQPSFSTTHNGIHVSIINSRYASTHDTYDRPVERAPTPLLDSDDESYDGEEENTTRLNYYIDRNLDISQSINYGGDDIEHDVFNEEEDGEIEEG